MIMSTDPLLMATKTKTGFLLIRDSFTLLAAHKRLFLFPVLGYLCKYTLYLWIITPFIKNKELIFATQAKLSPIYFLFIVVSFMLFLFVINLILFFFNSAIVENLLHFIKYKKEARIVFGFKQAVKNYWRVYLWALYAGTFGICVNLIPRNSDAFKKTRAFLHHNHWSIAGLFALIQVIDKKYGPITTLKKSSQLVHDTWGQQLRPTFTVNGLFMLLRSAAFIPVGITFVIDNHQRSLWIAGGVTLSLLLLISTFYQMLNTTIRVVCYCYASEGIVAKPFTKELLAGLYKPMGKHTR